MPKTRSHVKPPQDAIAICHVADYLKEVVQYTAGPKHLRVQIWFRGQADSAWPLEPILERTWLRERIRSDCVDPKSEFDDTMTRFEMELIQRFRREAALYLPTDSTLVDIYFAARHHGLPTRLFDWSTNALAALFFAVCEQPEKDGAVFLLHPRGALAPKGPMDVRDPTVTAAIDKVFHDQENIDRSRSVVIPILPDARVGRMLQQGSCFTLHPPGSPPISARAFKKCEVPAAQKEVILTELRSAGANWATLFPDLDHLVREIRTELQLHPPK